jgi:hypothetical protein
MRRDRDEAREAVNEPGRRPTPLRLGIWVVVGALAIYLIVNGLLGIMAKGG